ncbi:hypothetical protein ACN261_30080 [Micromonospora sp. WMMD723]|uniref:hypothetical protein n=2 Tax=unclassified Micromonospora TaxID=2617518 RepID=UPI003CE8E066
MKGFWRWGVGFVGLALLGIGSWEIVQGRDGSAVIAIIAACALLFASPLVVDRLSEVAIGLDGVSLGLVSDLAQIAPQAAQILGDSKLMSLADSYAIVREEFRGEENRAVRVVLQDLLVERAASLATYRKFDPSEVRRLFTEGAPVVRVLALGLMRGDPSLADAETIRAAITESRSGNEQYQGLLLAEAGWNRLSTADRSALLSALDETPIKAGSDRAAIADRIRASPRS